MTCEKQDVIFRAMHVEDLAAVKEIERLSFRFPWSENMFVHELLCNTRAKYTVMTIEDQVVGYCGCWVVLEGADIVTIAIHPEYRGQGLGEYLLRHVINEMQEVGVRTITLETRVSNESAQKLYHKLGFSTLGVRKGYYQDLEDALVMQVNLYENESRHVDTWN